VRARAGLTVGPGRRILRLAEDPPVAFRPTPDAVYLVGTAGGPTGVDEVAVDIDVLDDGDLTVRSAAATVVYAGAGTTHTVTVTVGPGARIVWAPEPVIVTAGADHHQHAALTVDAAASIDWTDVVLLGRHGEGPGRADLRLDATVGGRILLRHQLVVGPGAPGWDGPAVVGPYRAIGVRLVAGPAWASDPPPGGVPLPGGAPPTATALPTARAVWMRLDGPGWLLTAVAVDLPDLLSSMAAAGEEIRRTALTDGAG
jgi:urease accessory protein